MCFWKWDLTKQHQPQAKTPPYACDRRAFPSPQRSAKSSLSPRISPPSALYSSSQPALLHFSCPSKFGHHCHGSPFSLAFRVDGPRFGLGRDLPLLVHFLPVRELVGLDHCVTVHVPVELADTQKRCGCRHAWRLDASKHGRFDCRHLIGAWSFHSKARV